MMPPPPLLRSPPFPGVRPRVAAISHAGAGMANMAEAEIERLFAAIRDARVGGAFWASPPPAAIGRTAILRPRSAAECREMLAASAAEDAGATPLISLPDARWASTPALRLRRAGVAVRVGEHDPWPLLRPDNRVHAHGDDEIAALALIAGTPVRLMSSGRYATRAGVVAALLEHTAYRDPFTGASTAIDAAIAQLGAWRREIDANRDIVLAVGIAWWKRAAIRRFLWAPGRPPLAFGRAGTRSLRRARRAAGAIAIWPSRVPPAFVARAASDTVPLVRLEDGFIRSVGLGSNLFPPFSIAADARGIHYDPSAPSDLERLLQAGDLPPAMLCRAAALRDVIVAAGISKYGGGTDEPAIARDPARRLVLVAGQVEDDLSVLLGGGDVGGNLDLLRRARALEPEAEIWFRPHPDVDAGHRRGKIDDVDALRFVDKVVRDGGMARLLDRVDGVHVLTSLTGFEALLRGRDVTVHGLPFYAGWGLTRDLATTPARRTRRLDLLELIAGVLILYPRYLDPVTALPCTAETLVARFAAQAAPGGSWLTRLRRLQGWLAARR